MLATRERNTEPIPGYRLLEPLGRGGFGEVWKCLAPGGLYLPCVVPGPEIQLNFSTRARPQPVTLTGKCVRVQRCGEDWYEAGIHIG